MKLNVLTKEEERVILHKGTEIPFTGQYNDHFKNGVYVCKHCNSILYLSTDKFASDCGWPSFDDEVINAITKTREKDGRIEISCSNCKAHLGHVFQGENLTKKDTRHCVNSISLKFIPKSKIKLENAFFAAGCFWGVEYLMRKVKGVLKITVGYSGGHKINPSYEEVCSGDTGHLEALEVIYNPKLVTYKQLVKYFFEIHDFSQEDGQGPDKGEQYKSAIFYTNLTQKKIAEEIIKILKEKNNVATKLIKFNRFYPAEIYHQNYYGKNGKTPYCHKYVKKF